MRASIRAVSLVLLAVALAGCPKRDVPPDSAYDPELVDAARQAAEAKGQGGAEAPAGEAPVARAECDRETGGCPEGFLCWDSWYCKLGTDQCSAAGDKRCHKLCATHADCPADMPQCVARAIFRGSAEGTEERFCVAGD